MSELRVLAMRLKFACLPILELTTKQREVVYSQARTMAVYTTSCITHVALSLHLCTVAELRRETQHCTKRSEKKKKKKAESSRTILLNCDVLLFQDNDGMPEGLGWGMGGVGYYFHFLLGTSPIYPHFQLQGRCVRN